MMHRRPRVLVCESEALLARRFGRALDCAGYEVSIADNTRRALDALRTPPAPDVVLLDLDLGDGAAERMLDALGEHLNLAPPPPRIGFVAGVDDAHCCIALMAHGCPVLRKPVSATALVACVRCLLLRRDAAATCAVEWQLSGREAEWLRNVAAGVPSKELAAAMRCSPHTVTTYARRVLRKAGCRSQQEVLVAILRAAQSAWLSVRTSPAFAEARAVTELGDMTESAACAYLDGPGLIATAGRSGCHGARQPDEEASG